MDDPVISDGAISTTPKSPLSGISGLELRHQSSSERKFCTDEIELYRHVQYRQTTGQLTNIGTYTLSATPFMAAFNPSGKRLYVSHPASNKITVLNVDSDTGAISWNSEIPTGA
jgi:6-phosphogluconolactonase (cycloisomerase 2 family)